MQDIIGQLKHLNFILRVYKIYWLSTYSPNLNTIENIWAIIMIKIAGKTFTTINSLKMNYIQYGENMMMRWLWRHE